MASNTELKAFVRFMEDPYQVVAYEEHAILRGLNFRAKEDTWLLIVKLEYRLGGKKVAFIETKSCIECVLYFLEYLTKKNVPLKWRDDKY